MKLFVIALFSAAACVAAPFRINQEGRILGPQIPVNGPTQFSTPTADAIMASLQIFPVTNSWNEEVTNRPLDPNSANLIANINADLSASRRHLVIFLEMNYALVPDGQPNVPIPFFNYPAESDPGPYPIPSIWPIEAWPGNDGRTLIQSQMDIGNVGGDRHAILIQPGTYQEWETWETKLLPDSTWQASNGALFNFASNNQRRAGWTSGDAAGLSMLGGLVRFDECERGMVEHAMRIVVKRSRTAYLYPATHQAGSTSDPNVPAMGQRLRLRANYSIPAGWPKESQAVAKALQKYGALVADNGNFLSISAVPDDRWPAGCFDALTAILPIDFEVVTPTGPLEGPRSPNPIVLLAGPDQVVSPSAGADLNATVSGGTGTVHLNWTKVAGPASATFTSATSAATHVTFGSSGDYTLEVAASDGVHAKAFDALVVHVQPSSRTVTGMVNFGELSAGGTQPFTATFQFRNPGTATVIASILETIKPDGSFALHFVPAGRYDLALEVSHWLRKVVSFDTTTGNASGLTLTLVNGDVTQENQVDTADYAAIAASFGTFRGDLNWLESADLNGDLAINVADYAIFAEHYGQYGDD